MARFRQALVILFECGALFALCWTATGSLADGAPRPVFATVDGMAISTEEFEGMLSATIRQKFYHRRPPEEQLAALRQAVADRLVNRLLLLSEGQRRGIQPDEEKVRAEIAAFEQRNRDQPQWQENRAQVLPALTRRLEGQSVIAQLEAATRVAPPPSEAELRAYYNAHPDSFTEPERVRLSIMLFKVEPTGPGSAWKQALDQAQYIVEQLRVGADFAELARLHSGDHSAQAGGDMGYQHRGMLPPGVESEIDKMAVGAISEPFRLLEGMAVFRLTERQPARLRDLQEVRRNVAELWARERGEIQWRELLGRLRTVAEIRIGGSRVPGAVDGDTAVGDAGR